MWRYLMFLAVCGLAFAEDSCPAPPSDVVTPCALNDTACIGQHLANNSDCSADTWKCLPQQATILDLDYEAPFFNCSHTDQYLTVKNVDKCAVSAYQQNTTSGVTVLSLTCTNLSIEANRKTVYHQPQQEDQVYYFWITGVYSSITFTVNLPNSDNLDICRVKAQASADVPPIEVKALDAASEAFVSQDPLGMLTTNLDIWVRELYNYRATPVLRLLVNNLLCGYNCATCSCS